MGRTPSVAKHLTEAAIKKYQAEIVREDGKSKY